MEGGGGGRGKGGTGKGYFHKCGWRKGVKASKIRQRDNVTTSVSNLWLHGRINGILTIPSCYKISFYLFISSS